MSHPFNYVAWWGYASMATVEAVSLCFLVLILSAGALGLIAAAAIAVRRWLDKY